MQIRNNLLIALKCLQDEVWVLNSKKKVHPELAEIFGNILEEFRERVKERDRTLDDLQKNQYILNAQAVLWDRIKNNKASINFTGAEEK